jgi:hypothetical protein
VIVCTILKEDTTPGGTTIQRPICPHCHKEIEVLEPSDLDHLGITPNPRAAAVESGELPVWARLRGGKLFLYLKKDVDALVETRRLASWRTSAENAGFGDLSDESLKDLFEHAEQLRRHEGKSRRPSGARTH